MQAFLQSLLLFSALLWTCFSSFALTTVAQGASIGINSSICGSPDDPCMNQRSWNQCKKFESSGCQQIIVAQSCPVQFGCGDSNNASRPPASSANEKANSTSICGSPNDACMNTENWNVCNDLVQSGCQTILMGESCPVQFVCGDSGSSSGNTTQPPKARKRKHAAGAGKPRGSKPTNPGAALKKAAKKRQHQPGDKRPKE